MGALTSKPYAFSARPWELRTVESIDLFDAVGSTIQVNLKEHSIVRILPRINNVLNFEWITDRVRFFYDALSRRRILYPFFKYKGFLIRVNFKFLNQYFFLLYNMAKDKVRLIYNLGPFSDISLIKYARDISFFEKEISTTLGYEEERIVDDFNGSYFLKIPVSAFENKYSFLFCGVNSRLEAPLLDLRLRALARQSSLFIFVFGPSVPLLYPFFSLGSLPSTFISFLSGKSKLSLFLREKHLNVFLGLSFFQRKDFLSWQSILNKFCKKQINKKKVNFVATKACSSGFYEMGVKRQFYKNCLLSKHTIMYSFALNAITNARKRKFYNFIFSHHATRLTMEGEIVIPTNSIFESSSIFINMEGRVNVARKLFKSLLSKRYDMSVLLEHFWNISNRGLCFFIKKYNQGNSLLVESRYSKKLFFKVNNKKLEKRIQFLLPLINRNNSLPVIFEFESKGYNVSRFNNTLLSSYHRSFYLFDIYSSNSLNILLAYRRLRKSFINYL